ncbi:hypothetical protein Goklo_001146 [Gossypium klotzschianum]|uniref:RNase H type-1 domain-containing protein n=1 Tax=Gossypium klotzschianum TaxID=34286 RepID=A0A7J8VZF0_9ROSI|nr:hypothetical protein [Gossypium klotzschianum]
MCFYLNTNGVVHSVSGFSVPGGVICDGKGKWILGYNRSLGKCLVAVVELWGILDASFMAKKLSNKEDSTNSSL